MSGPKCTEWRVAENRRRIELARSALWEQISLKHRELDHAETSYYGAIENYGTVAKTQSFKKPSQPHKESDLAELENYMIGLNNYQREVEGQTRKVEALAEITDIFSNLTPSANTHVSNHGLTTSEVTGHSPTKIKSEISDKLLGRIRSDIPPSSYREILDIASKYLNAETKSRSRTLEYEFRNRIQIANDKAEQRSHLLLEIDEIRATMRGLSGDEIDGFCNKLDKIEAGALPLDDRVRGEIAQCVSRQTKQLDRLYVSEAITDELENLGYEVSENFRTAFIDGGELVVNMPRSDTYKIVMGVDKVTSSFTTHVCRSKSAAKLSESDQKTRDAEVEEEWCSDYAILLDGLKAKEINCRVTKQELPGARPVPVKVFEEQALKPRGKTQPNVTRR